jgi:hypothetical protein
MPTFPGVYTSVSDQSFNNTPESLFSLGLVGPATRGLFNVASPVSDAGGYVSQFGSSITGAYVAQTVAAVTPYSNAVQIARVGRQYTSTIGPTGCIITGSASGNAGSYQILTSAATSVAPGSYIRVQQGLLGTTANTQVLSTSAGTLGSAGTINLVSSGGIPLASTYTTAEIDVSPYSGAANYAEVILLSPVYGNPLTATLGTVSGTKSGFTLTATGNAAALVVGNTIKITQAGFQTTREAVVASISGQIITLINSTNTLTGQQGCLLQDNYTTGTVVVQTGAYTNSITLNAGTPGSWANYGANSYGNAVGLAAQVSPGTLQDTKKLNVFLNGALVATYDNLTMTASNANYWGTILAIPTQPSNNTLVQIPTWQGLQSITGTEPPANTIQPWGLTYASVNLGQFALGNDGSNNLQPADYVGVFNADGTGTGIKVFDDPSLYQLAVIAAPGQTDPSIAQELLRVCGDINAFAPLDVPDLLPPPQALDWTNGVGSYSGQPIVNNFRGGFFFNWLYAQNTYTGNFEYQPPSLGYLTAASATFAQYAPWFAAAGQVRGQLQYINGVRYPRISPSVKQTFFSGTNQMNPIILQSGSVLVWGNRTTQRLSSALQNIQAVHLVNYIVQGMTAIAITHVFDPNDTVLYSQLNLEFTNLLTSIQNKRGLNAFFLEVDTINNTPQTQNARQVIVNLAIIPTTVAEQILLNITVNQAGAILNAVNGVSATG